MNILKTFEIFNRETIKFFNKRVVNIFLVDTGNMDNKGIIVDHKHNSETQISVINNPKVYNLLSSAMYKYKQKLESSNITQ